MFAYGSLGVCRIWWLLQCSHLMVPLCLVVCPVVVSPPFLFGQTVVLHCQHQHISQLKCTSGNKLGKRQGVQ